MHVKGNAWEPHTCPDIPETHSAVLAKGSSFFDINGMDVGRITDLVSCGSHIAEGTPWFDCD